MKKTIYILSVFAVIAFIVVVLILNKQATLKKTEMVADASSAVAVKISTVKDSTYSVEFSSSGVLEALRDLQFVSDVMGRILNIYADEGSYVSKGKMLIQLDCEMLRTEVASNEAAYETLKKDYERFKSSNEQGGVTDQQLDNIRTQMIAAESRYLTSKRRLEDASLKAPISGTIYKRYIEVGSFISPGTKLFDIIDDSQLKAMCYVTEKQLLSISKSQPVTIKGETFPEEIFTGKINFIGEKADRSLNFPVEITITDHKKQLKSGMFVTVLFNSKDQKNGILIPRNAISGSIQAANVFVVVNGTAKKRGVIIGEMVGDQVEVLQGLNAGENIVVAGLINVSDGTRVKNIQQ
ncbi:MAG: efflux RND transporter periplasmic adaptor subunit [Ignavibacteriaceae bacterium]|jgi:RND family efflux transporter MFP subunit|nr:efflux RND transporter periplasmic adaptor subunit [Ignavibacteriaceae bacterium]